MKNRLEQFRSMAQSRCVYGDPPIIATGTVLAIETELSHQGLYWVELPNGKRVLAHLSKSLKESATTFQPNERVTLEMTPYDFDSARISSRAAL